MNTNAVTLHLSITGRVQQVGYRESMRAEALALHLRGWVRNRSDGSVEATLQGTAADVDRLLRWCHRGPPHARVHNVHASPIDDAAPLGSFERLPSA